MPARRDVLDEAGIAILKALSEIGGPASCKEIAEKAGLPVRKVVGKMRGLVNRGYVERVGEGKYAITEKGKTAIEGQATLVS